LVSQLQRGEIIPEMIMLRKTETGWKRAHLSGGYKVAEIEGFIKANLDEPKPKEGAALPAKVEVEKVAEPKK
jgi:hypothetical protein